MAAIVRVKRRRSDDPADSIVFSSKRRQLDESNVTGSGDKCESVKSQFKFAGTVGKKVFILSIMPSLLLNILSLKNLCCA